MPLPDGGWKGFVDRAARAEIGADTHWGCECDGLKTDAMHDSM